MTSAHQEALLADLGRANKRFKHAHRIAQATVLLYGVAALFMYMESHNAEVENFGNDRWMEFGDAESFAYFIPGLGAALVVGLCAHLLARRRPRWWLAIAPLMVLAGYLMYICLGSAAKAAILTSVAFAFLMLSALLVADLRNRPEVLAFIQDVKRLDDSNSILFQENRGIHLVRGIQGHGPWTVQLAPLPDKGTPRFDSLELSVPPGFAPGDFLALNGKGEIELSARLVPPRH